MISDLFLPTQKNQTLLLTNTSVPFPHSIANIWNIKLTVRNMIWAIPLIKLSKQLHSFSKNMIKTMTITWTKRK